MRPQDDRSQQLSLGLCCHDNGIRQAEDTPFELFVAESVQLVSFQKHWRSPTTLERRTGDVPRWLLLQLHDSGRPWNRRMRRAYRDLKHDSRTCMCSSTEISLTTTPMT